MERVIIFGGGSFFVTGSCLVSKVIDLVWVRTIKEQVNEALFMLMYVYSSIIVDVPKYLLKV